MLEQEIYLNSSTGEVRPERLEYLKQIIKRLVILSLILEVNNGLCLLMGLEITAET